MQTSGDLRPGRATWLLELLSASGDLCIGGAAYCLQFEVTFVYDVSGPWW